MRFGKCGGHAWSYAALASSETGKEAGSLTAGGEQLYLHKSLDGEGGHNTKVCVDRWCLRCIGRGNGNKAKKDWCSVFGHEEVKVAGTSRLMVGMVAAAAAIVTTAVAVAVARRSRRLSRSASDTNKAVVRIEEQEATMGESTNLGQGASAQLTQMQHQMNLLLRVRSLLTLWPTLCPLPHIATASMCSPCSFTLPTRICCTGTRPDPQTRPEARLRGRRRGG